MHTRFPSLLLSAALLIAILAALTLHDDPVARLQVHGGNEKPVAVAGRQLGTPPAAWLDAVKPAS
ncbi:hypothetical protein GCM10007860_13920 [Chitiniphilus shinanonensis]|uniref:Uncharacterized protein n=1 Tax=Chitiniphilus shinanonensis TaxID=553088 RepID=A0ABQ6BQF2_9NEIS|nr:hypothetical protein [Chitiniphilus shinanonensis]GLS04245.1 hypothetical protein GCM10007860_13920 [Chitiniphilus shinanonensis]